MVASITLFDRRFPSAATYPVSDSVPVSIGFSEGCSVRLENIEGLPELHDRKLATIFRSLSDPQVFFLRGVFKRLPIGNGLVYGIMQPGRTNPLGFRDGPSAGDEEFEGRSMVLEMRDGDNALMFYLHRQPTSISPIFHIQLKIGDDDQPTTPEEHPVEANPAEEEKVPMHFLDLPEELQLSIFTRLPFETRCCVIPAVCRGFFELSKSATYWNSLDLNSISVGSFHLFHSLKDSILPMVEHLSLIERIVLTWRGRAVVLKSIFKCITLRLEDWFHPDLKTATFCSPRIAFSAESPAAQNPVENFAPLVANLSVFRIHQTGLSRFAGNFPFHVMSNLRTLVIRCEPEVSELTEEDLAVISTLSGLKVLTLAHCTRILPYQWVDFFQELQSEELRALRLPGCAKVCDANLAVISKRFPRLEAFELSDSKKVTDHGIASFVTKLSELKCLKLCNMPLFGDFWAEVVRASLPGMKYFHASGTGCDELVADCLKGRGDFEGEWQSMETEEFPLY